MGRNLQSVAQAGRYYDRAMAHDHVRNGDAYVRSSPRRPGWLAFEAVALRGEANIIKLMQLFLIFGGTPLMSASIYMSLPRLARCLTSGERRMHWVSWL